MNKHFLNFIMIASILTCKITFAEENPIRLRFQLEDVATKMTKVSNAQLDCTKLIENSKKFFELKCDDTEKWSSDCYNLEMDTYHKATEGVGEYPSVRFYSKYKINLNIDIPDRPYSDDLMTMNVRSPNQVFYEKKTIKTNIQFLNENEVYRLAKFLDLIDLEKLNETEFKVSNRLLACAVEFGGVEVSGYGDANISTYHPDQRTHLDVLQPSHLKAIELEKSDLTISDKHFQLRSIVGELLQKLKPNLEPLDLERLSNSALGILLVKPDSGFSVRRNNHPDGREMIHILFHDFYQENLKFHVDGLDRY
jgi:hypothetical protein